MMFKKFNNPNRVYAPPIFVLSGSMGASGEQLVRKVLAQFQEVHVPLKIVSRVHHLGQIENVVAEAKDKNGFIVNTLVNRELTQALSDLAQKENVVVIDVATSLLDHLSEILDQKPIGKPGLYRELHETYFKRVEAIEFTRAHDDGIHYDGWSEAEIVLVGVSRVGKTPLSTYLSMLGWRVANVPLVPGVPPRPELFELDRRRVVGLTIDPGQLLLHRQHRQRRLKISSNADYVDPLKIYDEVKTACKIFRRGGFRVLDVTNKPIETTADDVIELITRRLKSKE